MSRQDTSGLGRDVVINGVRYPLVVDKQRGVSWWHEGDEVVNEGIPQQVARKVWESGFSGGMGETQQYAPGTDGYAFSVGWDAVKPGRIKLSGRRATVTPANSPVDFMTNGFIAAPAGGFVNAVGNFLTSADTDPHTITSGLSTPCLAVMMWTSGNTGSGTVGAGTYNSVGITDGTTSRAAGWNSEDNVATSNTGRQWASGALCFPTAAGVAGPIATVTFSGNDFIVTFNSAPTANIIVHFKAIGGAGVSAKVVAWAATVGITAVTGVGFSPDVCLNISAGATAVGASTGALFSMGAMDSTGNEWAVGIESVDGLGASDTTRSHKTTQCLLSGSANLAHFLSMDADGFTVNAAGTDLVGSLCLKGLNVKVGSFTKATSATTQAAQTIGFTTTGFFLASVGHTALASTDHAILSLGAASGTTAVEASCWTDEDAADPTDSYSVDDNALAFEILDHTDGSEDNLATCANIDMEVAGWLTWSAADANADYISYIAFAPLTSAVNSFTYITNGQRTYKCSVSGTTITVEEIKDHGNAAQCGGNALFLGDNYVALGSGTAFSALTTVAVAGGTDTWTADASGDKALAFSRLQDGSTARLTRGHTVNLADMSADGATWAADFEVGETTSPITNMCDSGTAVYISKMDGLYRFLSEGVSQKIIDSQPDSENGCGLLAIQGTDAVIYNDPAGLWFFDGVNLPFLIGPDANDINQPIDNVTHEPRGGRHLETAKVGKWYFSVYRVTDTTVKTYILAGYRTGQRWTWHSEWRYDGVVRGVVPDDQMRLWHVFPFDGTIGYHQLDEDGCPDPARNSIGHAAASTTYTFTLSESLFSSIAYLHSVEIFTVNNGSTTPVQLYYQADAGALTTFGSAQTGNGLVRVFKGTTAVGGHRWRLQLSVTTTAGYDNTDTTPLEVRAVQMLFWVRPQKSDRIHFVVDAGAKLSNGADPPDEALAMRANLKALGRGDGSGPAVACTDPDGAIIYINPFQVSDATLRDVDGELHWTIDCWATEWTTAST